jgi:hypothetical protein
MVSFFIPAGKRSLRFRFFPVLVFQAFRSSFSSSVRPEVFSHPDNCTAFSDSVSLTVLTIDLKISR